MVKQVNEVPDVESIWAAVTILGAFFPDRDRARMEFVQLLERDFAPSGTVPPHWLVELKSRAASELRG
jgi:hypothetical protein